MRETKLCWGIDLGGTKIEGIVLSPEETDPKVLARHRIATEASHGYEHILQRIVGLLKELSQQSGAHPSQLGVGHPGVVTPATGLVKNANTQCLNERALQRDLERTLGCQVACANDANCFALTEALFGAGRGYNTVFGIILGTGVGGGIVVNGKLLYGRQGIAGEWGHTPLVPDGDLCYCGRRGCVETVISGPALEGYYRSLTGTSLPLEQIAQAADRGEVAARQTLERLCEQFGRAVATVINILDPHCIVLGGGVSNLAALYDQGVKAAASGVFSPNPDLCIKKHEVGDSAGVIGAALLCGAL